MADYGLLGALGEGLKAGLSSYQNERDYQLKQKQLEQEKAYKSAMTRKAGLVFNPETGQYEETPESKLKTSFEATKFKREQEEIDPNSETSKNARQLAKQILENSKKGSGGLITDNMSAKDIEDRGMLKAQVAAGNSAQRTAEYVALGKERNAIAGAGLSERQNVHATDSGQAFEKNTILKQSKNTINSLERAESLGRGAEPLTAKSFNILQQDLINALAPGGAATEGKVNREMVETLQAKLNEANLSFGKVSDLRKEQPEVFNNIMNIIAQVKKDYIHAANREAKNIHQSFAQSTNPKVQETIKNKLRDYGADAYAEIYEGRSPTEAIKVMAPDGKIGRWKGDPNKLPEGYKLVK